MDAYKVVVRCHEKQRTRYKAAMYVEGTEGARLLTWFSSGCKPVLFLISGLQV